MGTERQLVRHTGRAKGCVYVCICVCLRDYLGDGIERVCLISSRSVGMFVSHGTRRMNNRGDGGAKSGDMGAEE